MTKSNLITGLDIGSSAIRIVVGQIDNVDQEMRIMAAIETPSVGVSKGEINSIEDTVSSVTSALEQAERVVGQPLNNVYVGVSGTHISTMISKGVIAVSRADNEITDADVERVIEASQTVATPPNYEILHVIPKIFIVDNQVGIKDPVGMSGVRLECETQIIQGLSLQIKNLTKVIYRTGLDVEDLVLSILANAEACLNKRQKELGCVLVNIGSSTTSLAVFEEGDILTTHVLPIGSSHITADIAIGLRTSLEVAEEVKLTYGQAMVTDIDKQEKINLGEFDDKEAEEVSLCHVIEIIEARLEEIFNMVDEKLLKIEKSGMLPAGVVLTGAGARMPGMVELAKKEFRLPASLGKVKPVKSAVDKISNLSFSTALGLVFWGFELKKREEDYNQNWMVLLKKIFSPEKIGKAIKKIKLIFKRLIP